MSHRLVAMGYNCRILKGYGGGGGGASEVVKRNAQRHNVGVLSERGLQKQGGTKGRRWKKKTGRGKA